MTRCVPRRCGCRAVWRGSSSKPCWRGKQLTIAGSSDQRELWIAGMGDLEAPVAHSLLTAHRFQVLLPVFAIGRIGKHEIEFAGRECVVRQRGPLRAAHDIVITVSIGLTTPK